VVYFDSSKSTELEKELVSVDTSKVTRLTIENSEETVNLYRENQGWQVALTTGKRVTAVTDKVTSLFEQLIDIRTDRLAAKDQSNWVDYQVDSTGTHIQVQEGDDLTLDMTVGQSGSTTIF